MRMNKNECITATRTLGISSAGKIVVSDAYRRHFEGKHFTTERDPEFGKVVFSSPYPSMTRNMAGGCKGTNDPRDLEDCVCPVLITIRPEGAPTGVDDLPMEMLERIAEFSTWDALVRASQVNARFRCIARRLLYQRMRYFLSVYLGPSWSDGFFATLEETSGAIIGAVPRCIVTFQDMGRILMKELPPVLNIVVPYNGNKSIRRWRKYLFEHGFSDSPRGIGRTSNVLIMAGESSPFDVKIMEVVQDSIGSVFLSASNTALMTAITSSHIHVLYSDLLADNVNVNFIVASPKRWWENNLCDFTFGLRTHSTTQFWQKPCGTACPVLWATISNVPPLSYQWMKGPIVKDDDLDLRRFAWRLPGGKGHGCNNPFCSNEGRLLAYD